MAVDARPHATVPRAVLARALPAAVAVERRVADRDARDRVLGPELLAVAQRVEHAIDLVENENVDVAETDLSGLEIVHKPARRRDDDIDAALQFGTLGPVTNATKHRDRADIGKAGKITERRLDLCREFTGRFEDEDAGPAVGAEAREHREGKGRRFAGTGLSRSDQVAAAEDDGDGAKLDRSRVGITGGLDAAQDRLGEIKSLKSHESE